MPKPPPKLFGFSHLSDKVTVQHCLRMEDVIFDLDFGVLILR